MFNFLTFVLSFFKKSPKIVAPIAPVPAPIVMTAPTVPLSVPKPIVTWLTLCLPLTKFFEKCYLIAYPDPESDLGRALQSNGLWADTLKGVPVPSNLEHLNGHPWTCGWGQTGDDITQGTVWTQSQADSRLTSFLQTCGASVDSAVKAVLTMAQKAALTDFVYNEGAQALATSTLLKLLNQNDTAGAADQFLVWDIANGKKVAGLDTRRQAERKLFLTGIFP